MTEPAFVLFCLFAAFDLVGMFAIYVINLQLTGRPILDSIHEDIINYNFQSSLFDCVITAAYRMLQLLFCHAVYRSPSVIPVALTTVITTGFTLGKVFLYKYPYNESQVFVYFLIFTNLLIAWVELWIFIALVYNPHAIIQKNIRNRLASGGVEASENLSQQVRRSYRGNYGAVASERYFSAAGSEFNSSAVIDSRNKLISLEEEDEDLIDDDYRALLTCHDTCLHLVDEIFRLAYDQNVPWKQLSGFSECTIANISDPSIVSPEFRINAPIFRYMLDLNVRFDVLKRILIDEVIDMPKWHPFVSEAKLIERLDTKRVEGEPLIEITYQTSQPALGGFVAPRDFVNLRYVGIRDGVVYGVSMVSAHKNRPPREGFVRGETGPCGFLLISKTSPYIDKLAPAPGEFQTRFVSVVNTDVKGGLPSAIVNKAMQYAIRKFISDLRAHIGNLEAIYAANAVDSDTTLIDLT